MQSVLADRFKLKIHREMREMDVYALVLAKPATPEPALTPLDVLIGQAGRIVVDRTGLSGNWQFVLTFAPEGATDSNLAL